MDRQKSADLAKEAKLGKTILVNSHRRSGTHFLIDSICLNVNEASFPIHRNLPRDFNIAALFQEKEHIYKIFLNALNSGRTTVIKSHLLPEEMKIENPKNRYQELVAKTYENAYKLYIHRDGMPVLISLYRFLGYPGSFKDFLHSPNDHHVPTRNPGPIDENRVRYWAYHVSAWSREPNVLRVSFEDLQEDFGRAMHRVLAFLVEPAPANLSRPKLPRSLLLHRLLLRMYRIGLLRSVSSTALTPGKGKIGEEQRYFDSDDIAFFEEQASASGLEGRDIGTPPSPAIVS